MTTNDFSLLTGFLKLVIKRFKWFGIVKFVLCTVQLRFDWHGDCFCFVCGGGFFFLSLGGRRREGNRGINQICTRVIGH